MSIEKQIAEKLGIELGECHEHSDELIAFDIAGTEQLLSILPETSTVQIESRNGDVEKMYNIKIELEEVPT